MQIHGFQKLTLLDYPGHMAATLFLAGCNLRCPFCQNASLVIPTTEQPYFTEDEVFTNLSKRQGILEGVCISGGEPTLHPELPQLIRKIKELGFKVKLDTNGTNPAVIKSLIRENLVDYIAMDIKNSKEKYAMTAGIKDFPFESIEESVAFLLTNPVDYEFRTTIVKELHAPEDMLSIGDWIGGAKAYYLQNYMESEDILSPGLGSHSRETLIHFLKLLTPYVEQVFLRGIE